jgi:hypothetical protein
MLKIAVIGAGSVALAKKIVHDTTPDWARPS